MLNRSKSVLAAAALVLAVARCSGEPEPVETVTATETETLTVTIPPDADGDAPTIDLPTAEAICADAAGMSSLELNDALAPDLGYSADRNMRTNEQTEQIREYAEAAFLLACPELGS